MRARIWYMYKYIASIVEDRRATSIFVTKKSDLKFVSTSCLAKFFKSDKCFVSKCRSRESVKNDTSNFEV